MSAFYGDDGSIAAFATSPGKSPLTLIRAAGKGSIEMLARVFSPASKLKEAKGNTVLHGWVVRGGKKIDEVLVSVFRAPKSYTGEDSVEISCHGGFAAGPAVMEALKSAGFRDALAGEFTFRAFVGGKLDLTRSESVMELVGAKTEAGRQGAISRLSGALEAEIEKIKKTLATVLAACEIYLDYSEDEIGAEADEAQGILPFREKAANACAMLEALAYSWRWQRIYQEGVLAVLAGPPNSGKSSLFNRLLKEDRSIVTESPGTTRDWIEAQVSIEGIPVRLVDTAGLRESADPVEKIGIQRSRQLLEEADVILYLVDGAQAAQGEFHELFFEDMPHGRPILTIWNKADIAPMPQGWSAEQKPLSVSSLTGEGFPDLCKAVFSAAMGAQDIGDNFESASLGSARQKELIDAALEAVQEAVAMADKNEPLDLIAPLLREAVNSLGKITGEVSSEDILEEMFSRFCVGK